MSMTITRTYAVICNYFGSAVNDPDAAEWILAALDARITPYHAYACYSAWRVWYGPDADSH